MRLYLAILAALVILAAWANSQTRIERQQTTLAAAGGLEILPGSGLEMVTPFPSDQTAVRLQLDTWYAVHLAGAGSANEPANGAPCYNGPGLWLGPAAAAVCVPPATGRLQEGGWTWRRLAYERTP